MLDCNYVKYHYKLSRQKELDLDLKAFQQIEFEGQLKNIDGRNADVTQNMLILTILEKIKETRLIFSIGSVTVLQTMANYQESRVELTNTQLTQLKSVTKIKKGTIFWTNKKKFQDEQFPHELFLTTRQLK